MTPTERRPCPSHSIDRSGRVASYRPRAKEVLFVSWPAPRRGKTKSSCSSKERVELIGPELDARRRAAMTSWPRRERVSAP
jgi:hypothetical protein